MGVSAATRKGVRSFEVHGCHSLDTGWTPYCSVSNKIFRFKILLFKFLLSFIHSSPSMHKINLKIRILLTAEPCAAQGSRSEPRLRVQFEPYSFIGKLIFS